MMDEKHFGRYLVGELFWELEQHPDVGAAIRLATPEVVEVISFRGYEELRIRVELEAYQVRLSWRKDMPPLIEKIEDATA
jgi:hypothetical protein